MKLDVILCNNFMDITRAQIRRIGDGLKSGKRQLIIVPDKLVLTMQNRILAELNLRATFLLSVLSISQFASQKMANIGKAKLSQLGATTIIEMLLDKNKAKLLSFEKTKLTISFAENVLSTIERLKSSRVSPEDLAKALPMVTTFSLRQKLSDILLIYRAYEEFKAGKYYDKYDELSLGDEFFGVDELRDADVNFCEIQSYSEAELQVVDAFVRSAHSVCVGVLAPLKNQPNSDLLKFDTIKKLSILSERHGVTPGIIEVKSELAPFVQHMLSNVLAVAPEKMEIEDQVEIYESANPRQEVEFVAADIMQKVRSGARFRDFAVNCANIEAYEPLFRNIFAEAGIAFWIDAAFPLSATELGKFIFAALDFSTGGMLAKDVYRFMYNTLCDISREEYELYKKVTTKYGISGEDFWRIEAPGKADADFLKYLQINQKIKPLFDFCSSTKEFATMSQFVEAIEILLKSFCVEKGLQKIAQELWHHGAQERSRLARQNYSQICKILSDLKSFSGEMQCNFTEFCKILRRALELGNTSALPCGVDSVRIGGSASAFDFVDYYYVVCAVEGNLPATISDVGLLSDAELAELAQSDVIVSPCIREQNSQSRLSVINSLCYPRKKIIFTYPINMGEDACAISNAVVSIMNMFAVDGSRLKPININFLWNLDFNPTARESIVDKKFYNSASMLREYSLARDIGENGRETAALRASLKSVLLKIEPKKLEKIEKMRQKPKIIANLSHPTEVFFVGNKVGVTQIEKFFDCPYAHFLLYGLKVKERETVAIQAVDIGNLLHAVLESFGRKISQEGVQEPEEIAPFVQKTFEKLLKSTEFEYFAFGGNNKALIGSLQSEAVRACRAVNYQLQHSKYKIKFIEAKFGTEGFVPTPTVVCGENFRVNVSGKIDRADICGDKLRIIDYKTSKNSADFKPLNFYLGKKIQLFYYMAVILDYLPYTPGGAFYLPVHKEYFEGEAMTPYSSYCMQGMPLDNPVDILCQDDQLSFDHPKSDIVKIELSTSKSALENDEFVLKNRTKADKESFELMLQYAKKVLSGAINDIFCGVIEPSHFKKSCEYCKFRHICRVGVLVEDKVRTDNFDVEKSAQFAKERKEN